MLCHNSDAQKKQVLVVSRYLYQIAKILHQTLLTLFYSMEIAASTYTAHSAQIWQIFWPV